MTAKPTSTLEQYAFVGLAACLGLTQVTIFMYVPLAIGGGCWLTIAARERRWPEAPAFFLPLVVLAGWTLVSSAFSSDPGASFERDRQLLYYLIVPMTLRVARGPRAMTAVNIVIAVAGASAIIGVVQGLIMGGLGDLHDRPRGLLGHYMTYSGVLMIALCGAAARLVFRAREWMWPAVAVPALLVALVATESRNAWIGSLLGIVCLLWLKNWKSIVVVPAAVAVFLLIAPGWARDRAVSTFDPSNATNRDRVSMLKSGAAMIEDHPLVGVGPNMVPQAYAKSYRRPDAVDPMDQPAATRGLRSHLHDVPVQLAAERGLPALAAWLWFVAAAALGLFRQFQRGQARPLAAMGLAVLVAAVAAGLFEHNFGDSEFLVLFLGMIALPFAAAADPGAGTSPAWGQAPTPPVLEARA